MAGGRTGEGKNHTVRRIRGSQRAEGGRCGRESQTGTVAEQATEVCKEAKPGFCLVPTGESMENF